MLKSGAQLGKNQLRHIENKILHKGIPELFSDVRDLFILSVFLGCGSLKM